MECFAAMQSEDLTHIIIIVIIISIVISDSHHHHISNHHHHHCDRSQYDTQPTDHHRDSDHHGDIYQGVTI